MLLSPARQRGKKRISVLLVGICGGTNGYSRCSEMVRILRFVVPTLRLVVRLLWLVVYIVWLIDSSAVVPEFQCDMATPWRGGQVPDIHDAKQISNHCHQIESVEAEAADLVSDLSVCILRGPPMAPVSGCSECMMVKASRQSNS